MSTQYNKKLCVLFVGPVAPPFGGIANNTKLLLDSTLSQQFDIDMLDTVASKSLRVKLRRRGPSNVLRLLLNALRLTRLLIVKRHEIVYLKATSDISILREAVFICIARLLKRKTVLHFHGSQYHTLFSGKWLICDWIFSLLIRPAHVVIFLSDSLRTAFSGIAGRHTGQFEVINNVVETRLFQEPDNMRMGREAVRILFVGRLTRDKGFWDILKVIPDVVGRHPEVQFVFGGVGESERDERKIDAYCSEQSIASHVVLLGRIDGNEKIRAYTESDVFLFPSHEEIFPNVLLEAMAAGLPIVTTRIVCIPEIVQEGVNGFLVDPGDVGALSERICALVGDPELRRSMGETNVRRARERYDLTVAVKKLSRIFLGLGRGNGRPSAPVPGQYSPGKEA
jgi:glycosyltransferase involved in cell wall biosynthesis